MKLIALVLPLVLTFAGIAFAQDAAVQTTVFDNFGGLSGGAPTDVAAGVPIDIADFDFRMALGESSALGLVLRPGISQLGGSMSGATGGVYRWWKPGSDPQLLASIWNNLMIWSPTEERWRTVNTNLLADTCVCTNGSDSVNTVYRKWWWGLSTQDYTQLKVVTTNYALWSIMGDSLVRLAAPWAGATGRYSCQLVGTGSASSAAIFQSAFTRKIGIVYEDTLRIVTPDEAVEYDGNSVAAMVASAHYDSIGTWTRKDMLLTLTGGGTIPIGHWAQLSPTGNYDRNVALYVVNSAPTSITVRCDTADVDWLTGNTGEDSTWLALNMGTPTWDTLLKCEIDTVAVDSVPAGSELLSEDIQQATLRVNLQYGTYLSARRTVSVRQPLWIFRYHVSATSVAGSPQTWNIDSLDYMTAIPKVNTGTDAGRFPMQLPVTMEDVGGLRFVISTYGTAGGDSTYYDSTAWGFKGDPVSGTCWFPGSGCSGPNLIDSIWEIPTAGNYFPYPGGCKASGGTCGTVCSLYVECRESDPALDLVTPDGANTCYLDGDSLVILRATRTAKVAVSSGCTTPDTSWHWPICIQSQNRFWCIGNEFYPNRLWYSAPNHPDSNGATDFVDIATDDGSSLTALAAEQYMIYVHKLRAIYQVPLDNEGKPSADVGGVQPTRSAFGAVSQDALVQGSDGWYFIGLNGVNQFSGSASSLISAAISDFWADSVDVTNIAVATLAYDQVRNKLMGSVPLKGSDRNTTTLVYDLVSGQWTRYSLGARQFAALSYPNATPEIYWGSPDVSKGRVYRIDRDVATDTLRDIVPRWSSGWVHLAGTVGQQSQLLEYFLEGYTSAESRLILSVYTDGSATAVFVDTTVGGAAAWTTERRSFSPGLVGETFRFQLDGYRADALEVTALRIDHVPAGVRPW